MKIALALALLLPACTGAAKDAVDTGSADTDTDTDADTDTDTDSDTDTDTDTDTDPDTDEPTGPDFSAYDLYRGGRYFDKWYADTAFTGTFTPDSAATAGVADGVGGPSGDGTLLDADGAVVLNDAGHDYRLKNFFGWDLRGTAGLYGADYANKATALPVDLLSDTRSLADTAAWFTAGGDGLPAFGSVLSAAEIDDMAAFALAMRAGQLARASDVYDLDAAAPESYTLHAGGNAESGKAAYAATCAVCHGADGTTVPVDGGEYSLGSFGRQKAYEGWLKVLVGHPGSLMEEQVPAGTGPEQGQWILDIFAGLCDRAAFPAPADGVDVADGDARCGAYLL